MTTAAAIDDTTAEPRIKLIKRSDDNTCWTCVDVLTINEAKQLIESLTAVIAAATQWERPVESHHWLLDDPGQRWLTTSSPIKPTE